MPFEFIPLDIPEVILIRPKVFSDDRGFFLESYKESDFRRAGISSAFVQDNHSKSQKHVLRGLHYQIAPKEQGKLVRVLRGAVWDVAVDIRPHSPTFGKWVAERLSAENYHMLWIPPGFAHGFVALEENTEFFYKVTAEYAPECERGIRWDDPDLAISWPVKNPILSPRDAQLPYLQEALKELNKTQQSSI